MPHYVDNQYFQSHCPVASGPPSFAGARPMPLHGAAPCRASAPNGACERAFDSHQLPIYRKTPALQGFSRAADGNPLRLGTSCPAASGPRSGAGARHPVALTSLRSAHPNVRFPSAAYITKTPALQGFSRAADGNRTHVSSLEGRRQQEITPFHTVAFVPCYCRQIVV